MKCERCGGRLFVDEPGELVCSACGRRLYDRRLLFASRLAGAINELTVRDLARELAHEDPQLSQRDRWDSRPADELAPSREERYALAERWDDAPLEVPEPGPKPRRSRPARPAGQPRRGGRPSTGRVLFAVRIAQEDLVVLGQLAALAGRTTVDLAREVLHSYVETVAEREAAA